MQMKLKEKLFFTSQENCFFKLRGKIESQSSEVEVAKDISLSDNKLPIGNITFQPSVCWRRVKRTVVLQSSK